MLKSMFERLESSAAPSSIRLRFGWLLLASIAFGFLLVAARSLRSEEFFFGFLIWNLFLAAVPLGISRLIRARAARLGALPLLALAALWLLFFPNAPYILTDLFHLEERRGVPLWYDLVVFLTFAWNGLILGFLSLRDVQEVLSRRFGHWLSWLAAFAALFLGSFGVYLGRYLRWNSWDLFTQPRLLLSDLAPRLLDPLAHPEAWGMTLVFTVFLTLCYLTLSGFASAHRGS